MLSEKITEERKKLGLSQEDLAEKLYVSRQSVSKWESGKSLPEITKIIDLAALFGVSTDYLLIDGDRPKDNKQDDPASEENIRLLTSDEICRFLQHTKRSAIKTSLGVFMFISSPFVIFLLYGLFCLNLFPNVFAWALGIMAIPISVAIGVALCVSIGIRSNEFSYISDENVFTKGEVRYKVCEMKKKAENTIYRIIAIAVFLFVLSIVPLLYIIIMVPIFESSFYYSWFCFGHCFFVTLVALGVFLILYIIIYNNGINTLLMTPEEKIRQRYIGKTYYSFLIPVYWIPIVITYFVISLITGKWDTSWIIWPVSGIVFPAFKHFIGVWYDKKNKR